MDERQQLIQSQEQLKQSLNNVFRDLKAYGKAVAKHTGAIYAEKKDDLLSKIEFAKLEREMESDINARTKEYKAAMKELLKKQDRIKREQRVLQIKQEAKQKISSTFGKLGRIKNDVLAKLSLNNIDVKLRNFYEQTEIAGLTIANKGKTLYDNVNKKVDDFTRDQIAKYYEHKLVQEEARAEREFQERVQEELKEQERKLREKTQEHREAMEELFEEQDRIEREQRVLQVKQEAKQKISSTFGKLGQIKNDVLAKLSLNNIDLKLRNFYEQTEIAGLTIANKGKTLYDNVNKKVDDFTRDQIAKYYEYKAEKADIKAFKEAKRLTEKLEIEKTNTRIKERKSAMNEVLNAQEREMYEVQHLKNVAKKQELIDSLVSSVRTR